MTSFVIFFHFHVFNEQAKSKCAIFKLTSSKFHQKFSSMENEKDINENEPRLEKRAKGSKQEIESNVHHSFSCMLEL